MCGYRLVLNIRIIDNQVISADFFNRGPTIPRQKRRDIPILDKVDWNQIQGLDVVEDGLQDQLLAKVFGVIHLESKRNCDCQI